MAADEDHDLAGSEHRAGAAGEVTPWARMRMAAERPVDAASVAVFRIAFGLLMVVDVALYVPILAREYYIEPSFSFGYGPLEVLDPPPGQGIRLVYLVLAAAGALVALGWHTRAAAAVVAATNTYIFLLDSSYFQNHIYLISLLAVLLVVLPSDGRWSLDARRRARDGAPARTTVPAAVVWLLRFQIGVPYFYGGLAKLNADWMHGEPLRMWLAERTGIGPLHTFLTTEAVVMSMNWGALVFDLAVVPLLLVRRTRGPAFAAAVCFHVANAWLFGLYVFPWLMIAATTVFFPPDWPLRLARRLGISAGSAASRRTPSPAAPRRSPAGLAWSPSRSARFVGDRHRSPAGEVGVIEGRSPGPSAARAGLGAFGARGRIAVAAAVLWMAVQVLVPLRHHLVPGDPSWTEQAHRFSWHMRLRDKSASVTFLVDDGERVVRVDPSDHLGDKQAARVGGHPERLVQFARHLSALHGGAAVRAETSVSLNGRAPQPIVDPEVDLASVAYSSHGRNDWILPLEQPRRRSSDRPG